jgi:general stress protein YciG
MREDNENRGFAKMKEEGREEELSEIATKGGHSQGKENNPGNFANDPDKAQRAGQEGGKKRSENSDNEE